MIRPWLFAVTLAVLAGCTQLPALQKASRGADTSLAYPAILPLDDLLAQASATGLSPEAALAARAAALRSRAAALRAVP